jgi:hypothetical protein
MHFSYLLYQAGHDKSRREQLEADARAGELAKSFARLWHLLLPPRRALVEASADEAIEQPCVTTGR